MFFIIKKGENVNVCIHDFDEVKRRIKQGSFCFKINTTIHHPSKFLDSFSLFSCPNFRVEDFTCSFRFLGF